MLPLPLPPYSIQNINFEGQNVRVVMSYASGTSSGIATGTTRLVANILFDYCGCSGTFFPSNEPFGWFRRNFNPPVFNYNWNHGGEPWNAGTLQLTNSRDDEPDIEFPSLVGEYNGFSESTGSSHTFYSPYTGLYSVTYNITFSIGGGGFNCDDVDFDFFATLYLGMYVGDTRHNLGTVSGTVFEDFCGAGTVSASGGGLFKGVVPNFGMLAGEKAVFWIQFTTNNRGDDLTSLGITAGFTVRGGFDPDFDPGSFIGLPAPGTIFDGYG